MIKKPKILYVEDDVYLSFVTKDNLELKGYDITWKEDGEAAFYGPKLDVQFKNVHGKEDTLFTIQIDFALADCKSS